MKELRNNSVERKIKDLIVDYKPNFDKKDWIKMQEKLKSESIKKNNTMIISLFKYVAAIIILSLMVITKWDKKRPIEMITQITKEEKKEIILSDGTNVWLNKYTKFIYPEIFKDQTREVFLEGESYFEVVKDSLRAFIINTSVSKIKVIGTKLNIKTLEVDNKEVISVTEGKVLVTLNNDNIKVLLKKGEKISLDKINHDLQKKQIKDPNYLSWKTGNIQFINTPLEEVVNTLSYYYDKKIILDNDKMKNIKLTATFKNQSLNKVLEIIILTLNVEIKNEEKQIRIISNK